MTSKKSLGKAFSESISKDKNNIKYPTNQPDQTIYIYLVQTSLLLCTQHLLVPRYLKNTRLSDSIDKNVQFETSTTLICKV